MRDAYVIIGAGGHAKTVADILKRNDKTVAGVVDVSGSTGSFMGYSVLGSDDLLPELYDAGIRNAAMGIGHVGNTLARSRSYMQLREIGFELPVLIHPDAVVADTACCGQGSMIGACCIVNADAKIGNLCIVNTGAVIEHDACIKDGAHIAPKAVVLGRAVIGENTLVGAGSVVLQGVQIGRDCIIGAGSVILHDLEDACVAAGNPGRVLKRR